MMASSSKACFASMSGPTPSMDSKLRLDQNPSAAAAKHGQSNGPQDRESRRHRNPAGPYEGGSSIGAIIHPIPNSVKTFNQLLHPGLNPWGHSSR